MEGPSDQIHQLPRFLFSTIQRTIGGKLGPAVNNCSRQNLITFLDGNFFHAEVQGEALSSSACLSGWTEVDIDGKGICYKVVETSYRLDQARRICRSLGAKEKADFHRSSYMVHCMLPTLTPSQLTRYKF